MPKTLQRSSCGNISVSMEFIGVPSANSPMAAITRKGEQHFLTGGKADQKRPQAPLPRADNQNPLASEGSASMSQIEPKITSITLLRLVIAPNRSVLALSTASSRASRNVGRQMRSVSSKAWPSFLQ